MYLRILKKDLKRKKTMNVILLIFVILATTFVASSANNMVSVITALDSFFEKAEMPDYWICFTDQGEAWKFEDFAKEKKYDYRKGKLLQIDPKDVSIGGVALEYSNTLCLSSMKNSTKIFDTGDREIKKVEDGEIYLTGEMFHSSENNFKVGDSITITANGKTKSFTLKGAVKDAMFGSPMLGITRFLISGNDYAYFEAEDAAAIYSVCVYTKDKEFMDRFNGLDLNTIFSEGRSTIKNVYIMDMVIAAVMLVVSICLILISMAILRFTIHFTMSEEFREIGVMKAIGIASPAIRGLYIAKYFAISMAAGMIGLGASLPFGNIMLGNLEQNIILPADRLYFLNVLCAFVVVAVVVLFCYFCTRKIKNFSPIDAIRNGENGERYSRKGILRLGKWRIAPVPFMAVNDILSGIRRFVAMILIFTLGILLIIIPINTINTLRSDQLISWFSMAECDHVVGSELMFKPAEDNFHILEQELRGIKGFLLDKGIEAEVFREVMFKMYISHNGKKTSSLAFQGSGDVTTAQYAYLEGSAPQSSDEVGISHVVADRIGAKIGDTVAIKNGEKTKNYMVTAIFQTMNNLGEGIRFYQEETIDYRYATGSFGTQVAYSDSPDRGELDRRKEMLEKYDPGSEVYTAGDYVSHMIGDVAGQLQDIKRLILIVVLCINVLVTVLMVKSFITKEKGEIATLKAIGWKNSSLVVWQTMRIGIVLLISTILAVLLSTPLSVLSVEPIFKIMGAYHIKFEVAPWEVFVMYPLIVLGVTVCSGMLAALQVCRVQASETAGTE